MERKISTGSTLSLYTSLPPPPVSINPSPAYNNMSQLNLHEIICQQQEQLAAMQMQIQALLAERTMEGEGAREIGRGGGAEVTKPQIFDVTAARVAGFIIACKVYIRMKMREEPVE